MSTDRSSTIVAVDMGSGGVRAAAVDADGLVHAQAASRCTTVTSADGTSVHRTEEVWRAVVDTIRQVSGPRPAAIVLGGTAHALVTGTPDRPDPEIVLWSDARSAPAHRELLAEDFYAGYSSTTACPVHPAYWPAKIRWLASTGRLSAARNQLFSEKDLVVHRLTGQAVADTSSAGATGLLDARRLDWARSLTSDLDAAWLALPPVEPAPTGHALDRVGSTALGIPAGTPVVLGGVDGALAHLGASGTESAVASLTIGTSLGVRMHSATAEIDAAGRCWSYPLDADHWIVGGAGSNGGNLLTWLQKIVFDGLVGIEDIIDGALARPRDAELLFLPYLHGERAPLWRADLSAGFLGMRPVHTRWDLARAVLDSIGCMVHELGDAVFDLTGRATLAGLNGGFTASRNWAQLAADAIGCPGGLPDSDTAVLRGAALIGWAALDGRPLQAEHAPFSDLLQPDQAASTAIASATTRLAAVRAALFSAQEDHTP